MTRLFINSTDPGITSRMKPEVSRKIFEKRQAIQEILKEKLVNVEQITLEIGCGHGHFLTAYGQAHPKEFCIGIDVNRGRIFKARKKANHAELVNVLFIDCDSMEFLSILPKNIRLEKIWILYPDPWPKKRHLKNRIVQATFLEKLAALAVDGGHLYLRTDYEPFLEWSHELITSSSKWILLENFDWPELTTTVFQELTENRHSSLVAELEPAKQRHQGELTQDGDKNK